MYFASTIVLGVLGVVGVLGQGLECLNYRPSLPALETPAATATHSLARDFPHIAAPEPTDAPNIPFGELLKRQLGSTTVCGLLATNTSWSWTCDGGSQCGFATIDRRNFGCCRSNFGNGTLGSCFVPTTCYDSTAAKSISCGVEDVSCNWSSLYCLSTQYPYCGRFYESGFTAWGCFATPSASYNLIAYTGAAAKTTSSSSSGSVTRTSVQTTSTGIAEGVPFTQQQQSVGGDTTSNQTPAPRSSGFAPALATSGEQWYGLVMSFFLFFL